MDARRFWVSVVVSLALASAGTWIGVAQYGGEGEYGGVQLRFSGQLTTAGSCVQVAQNVIRCQVAEGSPGTLELVATRTPYGPVNIRLVSAPPGWPAFPVASGWGTARAQYRFTVPSGTVGSRYELLFEAWTAGIPWSLQLQVILEVVSVQPPTGPEYPQPGYRTDEQGRFSVPAAELPNTTVSGTLTRCGVQPLPGVPVSVELLPKQGRGLIRDLGDIGAVRVSSPGYGQAVVREFGLLSSVDILGRVQRTITLGVVCLRPTLPPTEPVTPTPPVTPTEPIQGTTNEEGKFSEPLPGQPGTTVTGRLTECGQRPLPEQDFSLTPIWEEGELTGFTVAAPGYEPVTVTEFGRFSLFGLTQYLLGDVCLSPPIEIGGEGEAPEVPPCCKKCVPYIQRYLDAIKKEGDLYNEKLRIRNAFLQFALELGITEPTRYAPQQLLRALYEAKGYTEKVEKMEELFNKEANLNDSLLAAQDEVILAAIDLLNCVLPKTYQDSLEKLREEERKTFDQVKKPLKEWLEAEEKAKTIVKEILECLKPIAEDQLLNIADFALGQAIERGKTLTPAMASELAKRAPKLLGEMTAAVGAKGVTPTYGVETLLLQVFVKTVLALAEAQAKWVAQEKFRKFYEVSKKWEEALTKILDLQLEEVRKLMNNIQGGEKQLETWMMQAGITEKCLLECLKQLAAAKRYTLIPDKEFKKMKISFKSASDIDSDVQKFKERWSQEKIDRITNALISEIMRK